ncbi:MAG: hypothetical protein G01um101438_648 [Parcubacteria group bacterium Gr01-1014_38]|nr:MAG: hypothetical protein G01um101438_648 [Parcubacteria group bacterium Gr01-1014_38]
MNRSRRTRVSPGAKASRATARRPGATLDTGQPVSGPSGPRKLSMGSPAPSVVRRRLPVVYETSAGGVVVRRMHGQLCVALLKTRHTRGEVWVLPKGHVEHGRGETRDAAAAREVREELGIAKIRLLRKLGTVRWQFFGEQDRRKGDVLKPDRVGRPVKRGAQVRVVKTVHHYLFEGLTDRLKPQAAEGFLEARWVPYATAMHMLAYPTDRAILAKVRVRSPRKTS